jgi:hypothetical protein
MIAVQTLWTKPYEKFSNDVLRKNFILQALSAISISNFYETHLITDTYGAKIVKEMGLPYAKITTDLDCLKELPINFWAYPKFITYQQYLNDVNFIHFDNDVVINKNFEFDCCIVQNNEKIKHQYLLDIQKYELDSRCKKLGVKLEIPLDEIKNIYNVGILGFKDKLMLNHYINFNMQLYGDYYDVLKEQDFHTMKLFFIYAEQMILDKITGSSCLKTVYNEYYDEAHGYESIEQIRMRYEFELAHDYTSNEIDKIYPHNLFRLSDIKYCHFFSDFKTEDKIYDHIDFYLKYMYPERYKTIKKVIDKL